MQKFIYPTVRYVFGAGMAFFGLNNLFHFLPPHNFAGKSGEVIAAFEATGYIMPVVALTQLILAVALISNRYVAFALLLFCPIVVNILLFHLFLDLAGMMQFMPLLCVTMYLLIRHQSTFVHLLKK